jgi:m7GpppX diphosphatase
MLQSILNEGPAAIEKVYGVKRKQLRVFVHYQPQFYHFHVHFTRLENDIGCQVERGHLLSDIIQNLEINRGFYLKRRITFKLPTNDQLYLKIKAHQEENI